MALASTALVGVIAPFLGRPIRGLGDFVATFAVAMLGTVMVGKVVRRG